MRLTVFSSGSAGNSTLLECDDCNILIDAGIPKKGLIENLSKNNLTLEDIDALLITHEHGDHIKGLSTLLKYEGIKIYMTKGTANWILKSYEIKYPKVYNLLKCRIDNGSVLLINRLENSMLYEDVLIGNTLINVLPTFHDAAESIGFIFNENDKKFVYITDTGYVHQSLYEILSNADAYMLECNHDPAILMHSARPYQTKIRILSDHGHLSNEDSIVTLAHIMGVKTRLVVHAHISQECNLTQIIEITRGKVLYDYGIDTTGIEFVISGPFRSKEYLI